MGGEGGHGNTLRLRTRILPTQVPGLLCSAVRRRGGSFFSFFNRVLLTSAGAQLSRDRSPAMAEHFRVLQAAASRAGVFTSLLLPGSGRGAYERLRGEEKMEPCESELSGGW